MTTPTPKQQQSQSALKGAPTLRDQITEALYRRLREQIGSDAGAQIRAEAKADDLADALLPVVDAETAALRERLAELENALDWQTSCTSCARLLDSAAARELLDASRPKDDTLTAVERQRDDAIAALTRHAAEAHRRKWAHEDDNQAAFDALHRLGDEILASRDRLTVRNPAHSMETP